MATVADLPHSANLANRWDNLRDYITSMESDISTNASDIATNASAIANIATDKVVGIGWYNVAAALTGSLAPVAIFTGSAISGPDPDTGYSISSNRWNAQRAGFATEWHTLGGTYELEEIGASTADVEIAIQESFDGSSWTTVNSYVCTLVSGEHKTVHVSSRAFKFADANAFARIALREVSGSVQVNDRTQTLVRLA